MTAFLSHHRNSVEVEHIGFSNQVRWFRGLGTGIGIWEEWTFEFENKGMIGEWFGDLIYWICCNFQIYWLWLSLGLAFFGLVRFGNR
jgi:hypothetical protein